jgi:hypothetical protein
MIGNPNRQGISVPDSGRPGGSGSADEIQSTGPMETRPQAGIVGEINHIQGSRQVGDQEPDRLIELASLDLEKASHGLGEVRSHPDPVNRVGGDADHVARSQVD